MSGGEREMVARILAALGPASEGMEVGPGDDAAVLSLPPGRLVLTVDTQREDVHFRRPWLTPGDLGRRAVAVAASDVGAMGGRPAWSLCAAAIPADEDPEWLEEVFRGLGDGGRELGCPVAGGDLSVGDRVELVVTVAGVLDQGVRPLLRSGARPGHRCWLLGQLGHAAAGRALLAADRRLPGDGPWLEAYRRPRPLLGLGADLAAGGVVAAMMDVSDGLGIDLARMCSASGVGVEVAEEALHDGALEHVAVRLDADAVAWQVAGGDDYALLAAAPASAEAELVRAAGAHGVVVRPVGTFTERRDELVLRGRDGGGRRLDGGWDPFASAERES